MDRRVKERLIGASILVALIVLVVPELLSGPKPAASHAPMLPAATPEPVRNVLVDLSTSKPPTSEETDAAAEAASAASAPASAVPSPVAPSSGATPSASTPSASTPSASTPVKAPPPATKPQSIARAAPVESATPSPISAKHGSWSVQLGSFASRANADNLTRQMKGQGFSAFVLIGGSGSSVRYRVRVGPLPDRDSAERMAAKLKAVGHDSSLVAPAG